jgi:predicted nicotinamide N-methyase
MSHSSQEDTSDEIHWLERQVHKTANDDEVDNAGLDLFDSSPPLQFKTIQFPTLPPIQIQAQDNMPTATGLALWQGTERLSHYLVQHANLVQAKSVLEVGAGTGLCGIVAHLLGASRVLVTDGDSTVLPNLRRNVEPYSNAIKCRQLIWGRRLSEFQTQHGTFDVILAADCIYMPPSLVPFWETMEALLSAEGCVVFCHPSSSQVSRDVLWETANKFGFQITAQHDQVHLVERRTENY